MPKACIAAASPRFRRRSPSSAIADANMARVSECEKRGSTRVSRTLGMITPAFGCERYDATSHGNVLTRRTKGVSSCTQLNGSRDQIMHSLKLLHPLPLGAVRGRSWGVLARPKKCGSPARTRTWGAHHAPLPRSGTRPRTSKARPPRVAVHRVRADPPVPQIALFLTARGPSTFVGTGNSYRPCSVRRPSAIPALTCPAGFQWPPSEKINGSVLLTCSTETGGMPAEKDRFIVLMNSLAMTA